MKEIVNQMFQTIKEKKTQSIVILGLLVLTIIIIIFLNMNSLNNDKNKLYPNNDYIFTYNDSQLKNSDFVMPYINLIGEDIYNINQDIKALYYENDILKEGYLNYKYYINDDIISLIIEKYLYSVNDFPSNVYFYNFSISNKKALSDNEITETIYFGARNSSKILYVNKDATVNNEKSNISKLNIYYKLGKITKIEWSYDFE